MDLGLFYHPILLFLYNITEMLMKDQRRSHCRFSSPSAMDVDPFRVSTDSSALMNSVAAPSEP